MICPRKLMVLSAVVITTMMWNNSSAQVTKSDLREKRITITFSNKPLYVVLARLIYDYDLAIGFEQSLLDSDHDDYFFQTNVPYDESKNAAGQSSKLSGPGPEIKNHRITVNFQDARLEDVLNDIVKQMKNYDWEIKDDVINIFPNRGRDPKLSALLDMNVQSFHVAKGSEVFTINGLLLRLPELKDFLAKNGLRAQTAYPFPWYSRRPVPQEMNFSDLTLKELLNAVTKTKRGGWNIRSFRISEQGQEKEVVNLRI